VNDVLLSVRNLTVSFESAGRRLVAVDKVSFDIRAGEVFSIVGESGSGKSVTAMSIVGLIRPPGTVSAESVTFDGLDLLTLGPKALRQVRGKQISMIFQDPMSALNPLFTIGAQIEETVRTHLGLSRSQAADAAVEALRSVGIPHARERVKDYPHQFSGGMRQRAMIAMAMSTNPRLLIADEPTTALDVTIQAQVLELIKEITRTRGTTTLLITHDLGVVAGLADRMMVMYGGQMHETGTVDDVFEDPAGPYTCGLLESIPRLSRDVQDALPQIPGQPPSLDNPVPGCTFHPRCPAAQALCRATAPPVLTLSTDHRVRCHFAADPEWRAALKTTPPMTKNPW
jgi:oligopeptide/dipeptide ABC transporter ATP-binding protein